MKISPIVKIKTYLKLGLLNIARIIVYRLKLKTGWFRYRYPVSASLGVESSTPKPDFFVPLKVNVITTLAPEEQSAIIKMADDLLAGYVLIFGKQRLEVGSPPDWHKNPFTKMQAKGAKQHWSRIPDFSADFGDIKTLWEVSRFEWTVIFAKAYRITGEVKYLEALNRWLADWQDHNVLNQGANWKCGQETSFRVLHLLLAALVLNDGKTANPSTVLIDFVAIHAQRIAATLSYAIAQDNNHGTSEAAALFICGHWLEHYSGHDATVRKKYQQWGNIGRRNLEERIDYLVLDDGTFSQYSPTYQRVVLATLTQVFIWQDILKAPPFSDRFKNKAKLALTWLYQLVEPSGGDAPNLGANDGANVFRLSWHEDYRDFRPAVRALAARLGFAVPYNGFDVARQWMGGGLHDEEKTSQQAALPSLPDFSPASMPIGGFEKIMAGDGRSWVLLRTAHLKFRPPHADLNHLDLWVGDQNFLLDSGSYSYAKTPTGMDYPLKTAFAHNTVTFDNHDQMPALGRFLYGDWPEGKVHYQAESNGIESDIVLPDGNRHCRKVAEKQGQWIVTDRLEGVFETAVLRWHLPDLAWQLEGDDHCHCTEMSIKLQIKTGQLVQTSLKEGQISRYYLETEPCKMLEVKAKEDPMQERFLEVITIFKPDYL